MNLRNTLKLGPRSMLVLLTVILTGAASPVFAQLSRVGDTVLTLGAFGGRATVDTAYDPSKDMYLAVAAYTGPVMGVFLNSSNVPVTGIFRIDDGAGSGHFPRVRYSPDVSNGVGGSGGFLVTWDNGVNSGLNSLRSRIVAYGAGAPQLVSAVQQLSNVIGSTDFADSIFMENRSTIAYSHTSMRFLVAWTTELFGIQGRLVGTDGVPIGGVVTFESGTSRDPALTWNASTNEFGMVNTGFSGGAYAQFRRISPATGTPVGLRSTFGNNVTTYATGIDVNSANQYVMTWAGTQPSTYSAVFDANGTQLTSPTFVSGTLGGDLSMGLAYNPVSNSLLVVSQSWVSYDIGAVELFSNGSPKTGDTIVTAGATCGQGSVYPLVSASTSTNQWNVVHSRCYVDARNQIVTTGGSSSSPPPSSGGSTSTGGCTTPDPFASIGGGTCVNGGWVPSGSTSTPPPTSTPTPTPTPTSSGCTTPDPFASIGGGTCVNGGWIPGGTSTTTPPPTSTPTPTPTPTSTCTGTDPFAAIGGGHCVNGGWVPGAAPSSSTCSTPDPFTSIGGGVCVNGGWIPVTSTCTTPDPFTSLGGGVCINGGWVPRG